MPYAEPMTFLFFRFLSVTGVLLLFLPFISRQHFSFSKVAHGSFVGIMLHSIYLGGVFYAIRQGMSTGLSSLIVCLQPIFTSLLAGVFLNEKITTKQWLGLLLGLSGVVLLLSPKLLGSDTSTTGYLSYTNEGIIACFISLCGIVTGTLYQKKFCAHQHLVVGAFSQYIAALVFTGVIVVLFEDFQIEWNFQVILTLLWLVFALSIGAIGLLMFLICHGAASKVSSLFYLVPALTAVEGYILFDEALSKITILGIIISLSGVFMATKKN